MSIILSIESSCDDTSAAVLRDDRILSNVIASQKVHETYGGVVPELASRAHQQNIVPVVDAAIAKAGIQKEQIDAIAFTRGPGLLGSLMVGVSFAKGLSLSLHKPLVEVNHLQAHVLSHFIKKDDTSVVPQFPFICLLVSGGHTQILLLKSHFDIEVWVPPSTTPQAKPSTRPPKSWISDTLADPSSTVSPRKAIPTPTILPRPTFPTTTTVSAASRHPSFTSYATSWRRIPTLSKTTKPTSAPLYRRPSLIFCSRNSKRLCATPTFVR